MDTMPRMCVDGTPIVVPFTGQAFEELCQELTSPQAIEKRVRSAEAHLKEWNDPHEAEMRRLYAEQEKHQLAADLAEIGLPPEPSDEEIDRMALQYATWKFGGKP